MKYTRRKLTKIMDEIMTYFYSIGANDILFHIQHTEKAHQLHFKSNFNPDTPPKMETLCKHLNRGRRPDLEESYWTLTGNTDIDEEIQLQLVGAMVDQAEINIKDNFLEITLTRLREEANE